MSDTETQPIEYMTCPFCGWHESSTNEGLHFSVDYPEWPGFCNNDEGILDKYSSCECPKCNYTGPMSHFEPAEEKPEREQRMNLAFQDSPLLESPNRTRKQPQQ